MSDYDSDWDEYEEYLLDNECLYDPEEQSLTKNNIILCELYNSKIHGSLDNTKEENIGYLVCCRFKKFEIEILEGIASELLGSYHLSIRNYNHPVYKNYRNIIARPDYIKPEIAQCIYLESNHCVAILKTFWIKLIQRKWRKICAEKKGVLLERCSLKSIKYREYYGVWPSSCRSSPTLRGMLSDIFGYLSIKK
jgi:hypothetical protein